MSALEQAQAWRTHARIDRRATLALDALSDDDLVLAYQTWWRTYTKGIRESGSVRSPVGVTEHDARTAGSAADDAVLALSLVGTDRGGLPSLFDAVKDVPYRFGGPDGSVGDCSGLIAHAREDEA